MRRLNALFNANDAKSRTSRSLRDDEALSAPNLMGEKGLQATRTQRFSSIGLIARLRSRFSGAKPSDPKLSDPKLSDQRARSLMFQRWRKRAGLVTGLCIVFAILLVGVWTWQTGRVDVARITLQNKTSDAMATLGLTLQDVEIRGNHDFTPRAQIRSAINANRGDSILDVDPQDLRATLLNLPWIKDVRIDRQLPNTLVLSIREHRPTAVWIYKDKRVVLGEDGHLITPVSAPEFDKLPVLTGLGANEKAQALLDMVSDEPRIGMQMQEAQLVRTRRWTLTLKNGLRIHLPEENPRQALNRLANLDKSDSLLSRDVVEIDMRLRDRVVVRTKPNSGNPSSGDSGFGDTAPTNDDEMNLQLIGLESSSAERT